MDTVCNTLWTFAFQTIFNIIVECSPSFNIYRFRTKTHAATLGDEEENERLLNEAFPSFDSEFRDVLPLNDLEEPNCEKEEKIDENPLHGVPQGVETLLKKIDVAELCQIHNQLFNLPPPWLLSSAHVPDMSVDVHEAFVCGYQAAAVVQGLDKEQTGTCWGRVICLHSNGSSSVFQNINKVDNN